MLSLWAFIGVVFPVLLLFLFANGLKLVCSMSVVTEDHDIKYVINDILVRFVIIYVFGLIFPYLWIL